MSMEPDPRSEVDRMVAFLRAQIDTDEQVAQSVEDNSPPWPGQWVRDGEAVRTYNGWVLVRPCDGRRLPDGLVDHIVRHNPARVLRLVAAHREILDAYEGALADPDREHDPQVNGYIGGLNAAVVALGSAYGDRDRNDEERRPGD